MTIRIKGGLTINGPATIYGTTRIIFTEDYAELDTEDNQALVWETYYPKPDSGINPPTQ